MQLQLTGLKLTKSVRTSTRCFNIRFEHATRRKGLIATSKISESFPETKILILTMFDDEEYLFHVLKSGAKGYILKNSPDEQLILAVRTVYQGETYVDMKLTTSLVNEFVNQSQTDEVSSIFRSI